MPDVKPVDQPHHVRLVGVEGGSGFVHGYAEEKQASNDADRRNKDAEKLGVKARYEVVPK